jgi:hypothetical protein
MVQTQMEKKHDREEEDHVVELRIWINLVMRQME